MTTTVDMWTADQQYDQDGFPLTPAELRHRRAVAIAQRQADSWGRLIDRLATATGAGLLLALYRDTFLRIPASIGTALLMRRAFDGLVNDVRGVISPVIDEASRGGFNAANAHYSNLRDALGYPRRHVAASETLLKVGLDAVMAVVLFQRASAIAMLAQGRADMATLVGTDQRPGILNPTPVLQAASEQIVGVGQASMIQGLTDLKVNPNLVLLQAVAAIDERTTPCCLAVHGQAVPIKGGLFHLTADPKYAEYMANPPFHRWCRTATAVILARDLTDALTARMRAAADAETAYRDARRYNRGPFTNPAHVYPNRSRFRTPTNATTRRT